MFKPPKDIEAEAIKKTVEALGLEDVTFASYTSRQAILTLFSTTLRKASLPRLKEGRSRAIPGAAHESLVVFSGASELKQATHGMPTPCLLKLHRLSTFTDMTYLARQAFEFAGHSWRMLSPEPFPITIRYSDLIAERLTGLERVQGWDSEAVQFGQIGKTLWFL
jgi:hypothetical protein